MYCTYYTSPPPRGRSSATMASWHSEELKDFGRTLGRRITVRLRNIGNSSGEFCVGKLIASNYAGQISAIHTWRITKPVTCFSKLNKNTYMQCISRVKPRPAKSHSDIILPRRIQKALSKCGRAFGSLKIPRKGVIRCGARRGRRR